MPWAFLALDWRLHLPCWIWGQRVQGGICGWAAAPSPTPDDRCPSSLWLLRTARQTIPPSFWGLQGSSLLVLRVGADRFPQPQGCRAGALEENPDRHCPVPMPRSCRSASTCRAGSVLVGGSWESRVSPAGVLLPLGSGWNPACPQRPVLFLSLRGRRMILPEVFSFSFN